MIPSHPRPRWTIGAASILVALALSCGPGPDPGGPAALVDRWVAMWNSYDLDEVPRLFLDDSRLTYFSSEREGVIRGMEALLEHHRGFGFLPGGEDRSSRLWVEGLSADLLDGTAVLTAIWLFQGDPASTPQRGPVTFVCTFREGRWWFVHMNFSEYIPSPPDSANQG